MSQDTDTRSALEIRLDDISNKLHNAELQAQNLRQERNDVIFQLCSQEGHSYASIARKIDVSRQSIQRICMNKKFKK